LKNLLTDTHDDDSDERHGNNNNSVTVIYALDSVQQSLNGLDLNVHHDNVELGRNDGDVSCDKKEPITLETKYSLTLLSYKVFPILSTVSLEPSILSLLFDRLIMDKCWSISSRFVTIYIDVWTIKDWTTLVSEFTSRSC